MLDLIQELEVRIRLSPAVSRANFQPGWATKRRASVSNPVASVPVRRPQVAWRHLGGAPRIARSGIRCKHSRRHCNAIWVLGARALFRQVSSPLWRGSICDTARHLRGLCWALWKLTDRGRQPWVVSFLPIPNRIGWREGIGSVNSGSSIEGKPS